MRKLTWIISAFLIAVLLGATSAWALPVIPGAVGHGTDTPAGRGGTVYKVTNLNASGPGSLRACTDAVGPRVCVFEVSGTIDINGWFSITNPYLTIAGQTAPSPGITISRAIVQIKTHDVLIQHIRFRPGDHPRSAAPTNRDAIKVVDNGGRGNVVLDHISASWAVDEILDVWNNAGPVTFMNSIFSEALTYSEDRKEGHSMGGLVGAFPSHKVSFINNLFAHNNGRNPRTGASEFYFANNVIYNWGNRGTEFFNEKGIASRNTLIGNVYIRGFNTWDVAPILVQPPEAPQNLWMIEGSKIYLADNYEERLYDPDNPWALAANRAGAKVVATAPPVVFEGHTPMPHEEVLDYVLAHAGARPLDRDAVDARVVESVRQRTGKHVALIEEVGGLPELAVNYRPLTIPDNPNGDDDGDGYTNLEEWLHAFSRELEPQS